jgi:hypothetical protein
MQQDADPSTLLEQPPDSTFSINRVGIRVPLELTKKYVVVSRPAMQSNFSY